MQFGVAQGFELSSERYFIMDRKYNPNHIAFAAHLRNEMTPEEKHLWYDFLRTYPVKFNRQKVLGQFIADFYCASAKLVLELDGSQHYTEIGIERDTERTAYLSQFGLTVIRIPNTLIHENFRGVCQYIDRLVKESAAQKQ